MLEFSERPWGTYQVLHSNPFSQVKEITVKPGARLSYQTHEKRAEHWFITQGPAIVTIDGVTKTLQMGDSIDIAVGVAHRMAAPETNGVTFIEVQTGTYFGEDDIVRLEDDFGRN
ncbi:{ManC} Mannose-6-phosphate isomerase [Candidatus Nanopelagicaceae bacterium]